MNDYPADVPSTGLDTNPKDPDREELEKERGELSSRYHSLYYSAEEYDRKKGSGAFAKKFETAKKLMDALLDKKTALDVKLAVTPKKKAVEPKSLL